MARRNVRNNRGLYYDDNFYDPARLIARNQSDDDWYNLGYLLGTAWGANYNQRGTEKATAQGAKDLDAYEAKMKGIEPSEEQASRAFNTMVNDQANSYGVSNMPTNYAEQNKYMDSLVNKGGEYESVAPKVKGYTDYLNKTPQKTALEADYSFRADEAASQLIAKMRADGRNDYQINAAMKALEPRLLAMDKEAKRGTVQQLSQGLFNKDGYIDMSNPKNIASMSRILDLDPTYGALLGKLALTQQDKELKDLQIANARKKLTGTAGSTKSVLESKEYEVVQNQIASIHEALDGMEQTDPRYKELVEELTELEGIAATMNEVAGIGTKGTKRRIQKRNELLGANADIDSNNYDSSMAYIKKYYEENINRASKEDIRKKISASIEANNLKGTPFAKAFEDFFKETQEPQQQGLVLTEEEKHRLKTQKQKEEEKRKAEEEERRKAIYTNRTAEVRGNISDYASGKKNFGIVQMLRGNK